MVDESFPDSMPPENVAVHIAEKKLENALNKLNDASKIIISADTVVICQGEVLGKPADIAEARNTLLKLSGNVHQVITGVCIGNRSEKVCFSDVTQVTVDTLTDSEIEFYIENYQVMDKAGAYGIQDWLGMARISAINGSYTNVMGLPTQKLWVVLNQFVKKIFN